MRNNRGEATDRNTDLEKSGEHICRLASDYKKPGIELLETAVQVLQSFQEKPAQT